MPRENQEGINFEQAPAIIEVTFVIITVDEEDVFCLSPKLKLPAAIKGNEKKEEIGLKIKIKYVVTWQSSHG